MVEVDDLEVKVAELKRAGLSFRNEIVTGREEADFLDDSSANPVELFQPA